MPKDTIKIETSISTTEFKEELSKGLKDYNASLESGDGWISEDDIKVAPSPGFTGAEIALFVGAAIASGITYDVCKYVVLAHVLPRIRDRFGSDAADIKEDD